MLNQSSINLCDYSGTYDSLEIMIKKYRLSCGYVDTLCIHYNTDEVWLGSEFCENLFLHCSVDCYQKKIDYFKTQGLKVQIAIPELHETHFDNVMHMLEQMENVDGFVVNDIGTAVTLHRKFSQKKIILGRAFNKSVREVRFMPSEICSKYEREVVDLHMGTMDSSHLSFFRSIGATGITTDSVPFVMITFGELKFPVYFQYPRIVLSQAAICEFSRVDGNNPLRGCKFGCFYYAKGYDLSGMSVLKTGKIISHKEERTLNQCVSGNVRLVYTL